MEIGHRLEDGPCDQLASQSAASFKSETTERNEAKKQNQAGTPEQFHQPKIHEEATDPGARESNLPEVRDLQEPKRSLLLHATQRSHDPANSSHRLQEATQPAHAERIDGRRIDREVHE